MSLRVVSRSGIYLGRIADLTIDLDAQSIVQYHVRLDWRLAQSLPLLRQKYAIVNRSQVVAFTQTEMVVHDAAVPLDGKKDLRKNALPKIADMPSS